MRRAPDDEELRTARRLFARALEAKGGLKIHTIHGFCERLLQRFPLEVAGDAAFLRAGRARAGAAAPCRLRRRRSRAPPRTATACSASALGKVVALTTGDYIRQVIDAVLGKRAELARMVAYHKSREDWAEAEALALKRLFGVRRARRRRR